MQDHGLFVSFLIMFEKRFGNSGGLFCVELVLKILNQGAMELLEPM